MNLNDFTSSKKTKPKIKTIWIILGIVLAIIVIASGIYGYICFKEKTCLKPEPQPTVDKKPAIYLYPTEDSIINVKLKINGEIIKDIPSYNESWKVFATKNGEIYFDNLKYDYLFYEARLNKLEIPKDGFVVEYNDLENWLNINLTKLGLNNKEKKEFINYWLMQLPKSKYYEIKILEKDFLNKNMGLDITPKPDTVIRINLYFKPLEQKINLNSPVIETPIRRGFTVIEWGGILDN
ncbi:MAG: hypothetical protein V1824_00965 [archaeon]